MDTHKRGPGTAGTDGVERFKFPVRPIDGEGTDRAFFVFANPIRFIRRIQAGSGGIKARQLGLVPISWMPAGVSAPVARFTWKRWMPRPFPGGKSTWVGNMSRSGELKVPT